MNVLSKLAIWVGSALLAVNVHAQNVHGVLRVVKGEVQVKNSKGETAKARIGGKVFPKDTVITGKDARAKIVMVDNNEINVSPDSQIEIQSYEFDPNGGKKDVLLNVIYGKVRSKVEQKYDGKTSKFQIKTPSAVAGVRGTDFMVGFSRREGSSQVVTFTGRVEFGIPGPGGTIANPVFVTPGMTAAVNAAGAAPSAPAPMPKEELAKMDKDSNAEPPKAQGPNAPNDQRQPAGDEKKDGAKGDGAGGGAATGGSQDTGASGNSKDGKSAGGTSPTGETRTPASNAGGDTKGSSACEMCGGAGGTQILPAPVVKAPVMPVVTIPGTNQPTVNCDLNCREGIKGGNTNLIIKVK